VTNPEGTLKKVTTVLHIDMSDLLKHSIDVVLVIW